MQTSNGRTVLVQGRIVWVVGDLFKGEIQKDFNTKQPKVNAMGEQVRQYGFGLAVPKQSCQEIWAAMHEEAYTMFPQARAQGGQIPPAFAMKYKDGDTAIDDKGVPYNQRKGYAGNIVLSCTTTLPIKFFRYENGANIQINEGIKCGDYVNVQITVKAHPAIGQGKAGLYLNPMAVQFLAYGEEIINTPSGDAIFGVAQPVIPAGGSATPIAPQGMIVPTVGGDGQPAYPQQAVAGPAPGMQSTYNQPPVQAAPIPQQMPQAHYGALPPQFQPPPQQQAPVAPQGYPGVQQQFAQPPVQQQFAPPSPPYRQ